MTRPKGVTDASGESRVKVHAIFPDGACYTAPTYRALEDCLIADAWNPKDDVTWRKVMAERAVVWSGWYLNPDSRAEQFLKACEKAGMLRLEITPNADDTMNDNNEGNES